MSTFHVRTNMTCLLAMLVSSLAQLSFVDMLQGQELKRVFAHIDAQTSALVRIDSTFLDALIDTAKQDEEDSEQTVLQLRLKQTREILGDDPIWLTIGFPRMPLSVQILIPDAEGKRIAKLNDLWDVPKRARFPKRPRYGPAPQFVIRRLEDPDPAGTTDSARLNQWKKLMLPGEGIENEQGSILFACLPPAYLYETYQELLTDLPEYLGGGPVTVLTDGLQSVSGTIDLKAGALEATIRSVSPEAAVAFADQATKSFAKLKAENLIAWMRHAPDRSPNKIAALIQPLVQRSTFKPVKSQVHWQIKASENWRPKKMLALAVGSQAIRSATTRLRNIALGILNYESAMGFLPPPRALDGPTGLSWRVHILPFLSNDEIKLYRKFALNEPWDSPTNIKLLPQMPAIYSKYGAKLLAPASAKPGYTTVVAPSSDNTILGSPKKVKFRSITDGTSNTILLVIVKDSLAVPWTAPQDYVFDRKQPAAGLRFTNGKTPVVMCDSSDSLLSEDTEAAVWLEAFEMNDGGVARRK